MTDLTERPQHTTQTLCNALWGYQLSFHPFTFQDKPLNFFNFWPDKTTLVETYREANLERASYDLCKLLLATNSIKSLDALLEDKVLLVNHNFGPGNVTLAHLACALGSAEAVQLLIKRSNGSSNGVWTHKDDEDHTACDVCFSPELRRLLPNRPLFRRKLQTGLPLRSEDRDRIFQLATKPNAFYRVVVQLQIHTFDVNKERNASGDLLIHVVVKGGLPSLPLLFVLINNFKADVELQDRQGLTPLCLAAKLGEEKIAEILVCVFGADINATDSDRDKQQTPLHYAVQHNHPRVVSMLVRRGANTGCEDKNRCEPVFLAKKTRAHECRQIIIQHIRERTEDLARQAREGSLQMSHLYLSDAFLVTSDGCTLLMLAAMNNREELVAELVKMPNCPLDFKQMKSPIRVPDLLDSGSISLKSDWFPEDVHTLKTAVHFAAERGYEGCLRRLLQAGAHPAIEDANIFLPLHYACENNHIECVRIIVNYPNHLGLSKLRPAIDIAVQNGFSQIESVLRDAFERRQRELLTPVLFEVAHSGNKDLLFQILENGDNVNPTNESHDWPLLLATGFGYIDVVTQLYEFGGHVTRHHKISRSTALHVAARGGHTKVVRFLLQFCHGRSLPSLSSHSGSDSDGSSLNINERNAAGATPLELAASQGHLEVVRLLLDHGASTTLPDSTGRLICCTAFSGTQFVIETHRKERLRRILSALMQKVLLKDFQKIWLGPSDFNLYKDDGDSILMVAAQHTPPDIVKFLISSAAACKPDMLVSPLGQPLPLPSPSFPLSSSPDDSDTSDHSLPKNFCSDLQFRLRHHSELESSGEKAVTALPKPKPLRKTEGSNRRRPRPLRPRPPAPVAPLSGKQSTTTGSSGSDEGATPFPRAVRLDPSTATNGPLTCIIRQTSPQDGQTALHRAAVANQHENVSALISADPGCANIQDKLGNTALHLACNKNYRLTVRALLNFECVDTLIRNNKMELPEEGSIKSNIKKLVCRHRTRSFPSPPARVQDVPPVPFAFSQPLATPLPRTGPSHTPNRILRGLRGIPETSRSPSQSTELMSMTQLDREMERIKDEWGRKKEDDSS